ncbi:MAG: hypothetical protein H0X12_04000 [Nocardioides sp.]|nr:hypothetical protein [Nocardioides sp.]
MKHRLAAGTSTVLLAVLSPLATSTSAHAATPTAVVTMEDFVLWDGCNDYPYTYSVDPAGSTRWTMTTYHHEGGWWGIADGQVNSRDNAAAGTAYFQFCDTGTPLGAYPIFGRLSADAGPIFMTTSDTFTVRRPATQTLIEVSDKTPRPGQQVEVRLVTMVETPTGFVRDDSSVLQLQQKTKKGWQKIAKKRTDKGKAKTGFRYRGGKVTLRGKSVGSSSDNDTGSFSVKVTFG